MKMANDRFNDATRFLFWLWRAMGHPKTATFFDYVLENRFTPTMSAQMGYALSAKIGENCVIGLHNCFLTTAKLYLEPYDFRDVIVRSHLKFGAGLVSENRSGQTIRCF